MIASALALVLVDTSGGGWGLAFPLATVVPGLATAGGVLAGAAVGLVASTLGRLYSSAFYALGDTRTPVRFAALRVLVVVAQPSLFDPTRAPAGKHTLWAYCHVPNGSAVDMTDRLEAQIERFDPGFRNRILARSVAAPATRHARWQTC